MNARRLWSRILFVAGMIAMLVGALDPLEGSLLILVGSGMVALGTVVGRSGRRQIAFRVGLFIIISIGVGPMWVDEWLGSFYRPPTGWTILDVTYPLAWSVSIWGPGSPRWVQWVGILSGLWYLAILVTVLMNPTGFAGPDSLEVAIFIAAVGLLTIGGCIYRLMKRTTLRWFLPVVVALGFATVTVLYFPFFRRTESVTFRIAAPAARQVYVAGSFNHWNSQQYPLSKQPQGHWQTTISLPLGRHEYAFLVDSEWVHDVNNPNKVQLQPPLQIFNSVINVESQDSLSFKR